MAVQDLPCGYAGKILRVDLTNERITEESPDRETLRKYVGGTALGAKYLYEEVPPGVEWSDPENRIMFFAGPLSGTRIGGSGIFSVISKGPATNFAGTSQANGFFAAFLKFAGFDGVIVQGQAKKWSYLHIHDGTATIRNAEHLVGKDTWETEDAIKKGLQRQSSVYSIGPAGEHMVRFACIVGDHGHVAAHNGLGAVMGSKKLKAVVAERTQSKLAVADAERVSAVAKEIYETSQKGMPTLSSAGTTAGFPILYRGGQLPVRNYTTNIFPDFEKFGPDLRTRFRNTPTSCWACRFGHCRTTEVTEGPYKGYIGDEPEYEGLAAMSSQIGQTDPGATVMLGDKTDRLGLDVNESGYMIGWIMECYEKGLLKKDDLDGLEMKWGDPEATLAMLKKIAYREGCGNLFAEGVKRAAEAIGGEAQECAVYTLKGATPRGHDHRARWTEMVDTCTSNTGTVEVGAGVPSIKELGQPPLKDPFDAMEVSAMNATVNGRRIFQDSLVVCNFASQDFKLEVDALNAVTGQDFSLQEALDVGRRAVNQLRLFSFRHGLTKAIEFPSKRYASVPVDGPQQGKSITPHWEALRSNYYEKMGWDPETGKPLPETLRKLGLGHLVADLASINDD